MTAPRKALVIWLASASLMLGSFLLPHNDVEFVSVLSNSVQVFLFILSVYLVKHESVRKSKFIFANFAALFSLSLLVHLSRFVGTLFLTDEPLARLLAYQYINESAYVLFFGFAICYVTIDVLFRDFRAYQKYLVTGAIVGGFFVYYYHPIIRNPMHLYSTNEIVEWKEVDRIAASYMQEHKTSPTIDELTQTITSETAPMLSRYSSVERKDRVTWLCQYLAQDNYLTLLVKPLNENAIRMGILNVGLILLFFGYLYKKDPPQGAYIEKMMFFFLMLVSLEIFHNWSLMNVIEWDLSLQMIAIGELLSAFLLCVIALFFLLRLRFITTAYGEFYETELVESPTTITRWRDALDNYVLAHFFSKDSMVGRFFVDPNLRKL
jgi:hypothetical protein